MNQELQTLTTPNTHGSQAFVNQEKNMSDLAYKLLAFTGTDQWHRHSLNRDLIWTDGVDFFAREAEAYWFLDLVALGINGKEGIVPAVKADPGGFAVVLLRVRNESALIEAYDDIPGRCLYQERVEFTDCPEGDWKFYLVDDGDHVTLLLPSEY